jgi:hypothetical protein
VALPKPRLDAGLARSNCGVIQPVYNTDGKSTTEQDEAHAGKR